MAKRLTLELFDVPQRRLDPHLDVAAPAEGWTWPPTSVTLIAGEKEAVLVDTVPTRADADALGAWIAATGLELTTIFITHGHLDHYLGAAPLLNRFPNARLVATAATVRHIDLELKSGAEREIYAAMFVDELVSTVVVPEPLSGEHLELEGHEVIAVAAGQSDHADSSYVHLPELAAVVVGDIAYNDVHCALMGSDRDKRQAWRDTIRHVQDHRPEIVVASHRRADAPNGARVLSDTIAYLDECDRILDDNPTAADFVQQIIASNPTRLNSSTVLYGAAALGLK
ncbi:MBL fold metallo-hydrolase [Mycolicibacterium sp. 120266]|uniref:MBL fold metallo-hydrolase n=1 Tax=Mycolicibacterium sp. 120266 TaxID=3090601 RepID=UPI00299DE51E|nr:MBL fold metallo-hydrolase [Mycolicibacterium sp. 120266]MDX1873245.1 MBL fold metallo-hydrolase [Mycolicibacterium sp. 120266]